MMGDFVIPIFLVWGLLLSTNVVMYLTRSDLYKGEEYTGIHADGTTKTYKIMV